MSDCLEIAIPESVENLLLPNPSLLQYYIDSKERCYWIDFDVDETLLNITREIINCNRKDKDVPVEERKPIVLWIFSYGGEMDACYNLLDMCALSKTPIVTINAGVAMSAGLLILLAGHKRYALPMSTALIHSGSASFGGTYEQIEANTESYKKSIEKMRKYIISRTNLDPKLFNKKKAQEWYLDAEEQLKHNIVHSVLTDIDLVI